jgi:hypothetical protein
VAPLFCDRLVRISSVFLVTVSITHFISFEVLHVVEMIFGCWSFAAVGIRTVIAMVDIVVIIYVAIKMFGTMKPWTGTYEDTAAGKPLWTVVSIGRAGIGRVIVVTVGAHGCCADANTDLGLCLRRSGNEAQTGDCSECKDFKVTHKKSPLLSLEKNMSGRVAPLRVLQRRINRSFLCKGCFACEEKSVLQVQKKDRALNGAVLNQCVRCVES